MAPVLQQRAQIRQSLARLWISSESLAKRRFSQVQIPAGEVTQTQFGGRLRITGRSVNGLP